MEDNARAGTRNGAFATGSSGAGTGTGTGTGLGGDREVPGAGTEGRPPNIARAPSVTAAGIPHPQLQPQTGGAPRLEMQQPLQHQAAPMVHQLLSHCTMIHPQFHLMTPQQQYVFLFQQQLIMNRMAEQSLQQQHFMQSRHSVPSAQNVQAQLWAQQSNIQQPSQQVLQQQPHPHVQSQSAGSSAQNIQVQLASQQPNTQQQFPQQVFQQEPHVQSQSAPVNVFRNHAVSSAQNIQVQQSAQQPNVQQQQQLFQQQPPLQQPPFQAAPAASINPLQPNQGQGSQPAPPIYAQGGMGQYPNHAMLQIPSLDNMNFNPLGFLTASAVESIIQADESNHHARHDSDDEDEDDDDPDQPGRTLLRLVEDHHWVASLQRIVTYPRETQKVGIQGRTPLHIACDHDAPTALIQAILCAWPEGAERVGTSHMNPLHITCSSPRASVDVVRVLLAGCRDPLMITGAKDVDGDTPLHAACRCGAPMDVLVTLLQANPLPVTWKDYEVLNPMSRLWVRYFILVGEQVINNIKEPSDLTGDLVEAWQKSLLLLQVMNAMENRNPQQHQRPLRILHAASALDIPRCIVRIAMALFPQDLMSRDETNRLPLQIAAAAPVYIAHDLTGEGYNLDDVVYDEETDGPVHRPSKKKSKYKEPSVIDILLSREPTAASERDPQGQLPLHVAIMRGKTLEEGVQALVDAYPEALIMPDNQTNLYPFMLAASVGRGRGDSSTIFALLRAAPELIHMALDGGGILKSEDAKAEVDGKPSAEEAGAEGDKKPSAVKSN
ncbi:hypothetical protein ACHAWF_009592 [Thalassiosira exigua]